ncbi:uncharacterized protein LOC134526548 isoform X2 [Chroicocephalus ridibundus]|uniref:uncharacterized protein LOC134526548 isoform X2 n=1 Tax=Chroicocephalus ridibundus TaxID=1192867 RepID=UPI002FDC94B3
MAPQGCRSHSASFIPLGKARSRDGYPWASPRWDFGMSLTSGLHQGWEPCRRKKKKKKKEKKKKNNPREEAGARTRCSGEQAKANRAVGKPWQGMAADKQDGIMFQRRSPSPGAPRRQPEGEREQPACKRRGEEYLLSQSTFRRAQQAQSRNSASAARLGARPEHGPSATGGETEARGGTEQVSTEGEPPEEPVLARRRSAVGHCPHRQLGPPASLFPRRSILVPAGAFAKAGAEPAPGTLLPAALPSSPRGADRKQHPEGRNAKVGCPRRRDDPSPQFPSRLPCASLHGPRRIPPGGISQASMGNSPSPPGHRAGGFQPFPRSVLGDAAA